MNRSIFFSLFALWSIHVLSAAVSPDKMVITRVVGVVKMPNKRPAQPGSLLQITDFLRFSDMSQAVVCVHPKLGKLIFKPMSREQLNTKLSVSDLLVPYQGERGLNGSEDVQHFQTTRDSLRLRLKEDLKVQNTTGNFVLYDFRMNISLPKPTVEENSVRVYSSKNGTFFLHFTTDKGLSKIVAEIEFMEMDDIRSELRYMAELYPPQELVTKRQEYLAQQYKTLPDEEKTLLVAGK